MENSQSPRYKTFVVVDTNIWVYTTRLLSTGLGAALIYALKRTNSSLALPEVLEEEIRKHTLRYGKEAVKQIATGYNLLEVLMGSRDDYRVPSDNELRERVDKRLNELGDLIYRVEFTIDHAKSALRRVMEESPPNGYKNQQFKDSAIWEAILELAHKGEVHFITEDKAFFKDNNPSKGLAENLKADCENVLGYVFVHYKLEGYLEEIKEQLPPLDYQAIANKIDSVIVEDLRRWAIDKNYELGEMVDYSISAFLTERPGILALSSKLVYLANQVKLPHLDQAVESQQIIVVNCSFDLTSEIIFDVQIDGISFVDLEGNRVPGMGLIVAHVDSLIIGRATIPYKLRSPLSK